MFTYLYYGYYGYKLYEYSGIIEYVFRLGRWAYNHVPKEKIEIDDESWVIISS